jgi:hypothetical protein
VLRRPVPLSYTRDLKNTQAVAGLINPTGCPDQLVPATPLETGWELCDAVAPDECRYVGTTTRGGISVTIVVNLPASRCDVGHACGTVVYTPTDITAGPVCRGTFSYTSKEDSGPSTIFNFGELMVAQGAGCIGSPSVQLAAASGGIAERSSMGTTAMLAPVTCETELNTLADRFNRVCDSDSGAVDGVPDSCSAACAAMWLPFASSCDDFLGEEHPELAAFTQMCEDSSVDAMGSGH